MEKVMFERLKRMSQIGIDSVCYSISPCFFLHIFVS